MKKTQSPTLRWTLAFVASAGLTLSVPKASADTIIYNTAGSFTWVCPPGVTSIQVECWGGGGAGGGARRTSSGNAGGGGGGGGAYARNTSVPVTPGSSYSITIPAAAVCPTSFTNDQRFDGASVSFTGDSLATVTAAGGIGGQSKLNNSGAVLTGLGGAGGTTGASTGITLLAGGSGTTNTSSNGGPGGAGASDLSAGNNATANTSTNGATTTGSDSNHNGGAGGAGRTTDGVGNNGTAPGGGGGGGKVTTANTTRVGGNGGLGRIILTYTAPNNVKVNNTDNLNLASSWTVGVPVGNTAKWDSTVTSANTTSLGGDVTFGGIQIVDPAGPVTINSGNILTLGADAIDLNLSTAAQDLNLNCDVALGAANVWDVATGRTATLGGTVSGTPAVTKQGAGTVILSGASTYTGATTVTAGTLTYPSGSNINPGGNGGIGGKLTVNGAGALATVAGSHTASGNGDAFYEIRGGGSLSFSGTANLSGTAGIRVGESSAGTMNMTGGTLNAGLATSSNLVVGRSTGGNGALNISGGNFSITTGGGVIIANAAGNSGVINISGSGQLATSGTGAFVMGPGTSTLNLNTGGTFLLGTTSSASGTSTINFNGGTLKAGRSSATFLPTSLTAVNVLAGGAIIDSNAYNITLPGSLLGSVGDGGLIKAGAGSLTLGGASTYTGATTVNGGILKFSSAASSLSDITVAANASAGARIAVTDGQFINSGDLTLNNNSSLAIDYGSTTPSTTVAPIAVDNFTVGTGLGLTLEGDFVNTLAVSQAYPLITWIGIGPSNGSAFTGTIFPYRITGTFSVSGNTLYFTVNSNSHGAISWNTGNGNWDTITSNWIDFSSSPSAYIDGYDRVLFGDATGTLGDPIITLAAPATPSSVTMSSTARDYKITGTGAITGTAGLTLDAFNTRTLTLVGGHSYTGATSVLGGTLQLGDATASGSLNPASAITIANGATLAVNQTDTVTQGAEFSSLALGGGGGFAQRGSGTTILNAVNTFTGNTDITNGVLEISGAGQLGGGNYPGAITITAGTLRFNSTANQTLTGIIDGEGGLTKDAAGTLTLTAANTYNGPTLIGGGVLQLGNGTSGNDGTITSSSITNNGTLTFNRFGTSSAAFNISGTGGVSKTGVGAQTLSGTNTFTGSTIINNGTLIVSGATNTGSGTLQVGISTGASTLTIATGGSFTTTGNMTLGNGIFGHNLNVQSGASLSVAAISNPWGTDYHIDGTLTASGNWTISTNSTVNVYDGAGSIAAVSLTLGNAGTGFDYTGTGSINLTGAVTVTSNFNAGVPYYTQSSGTLNAGGVVLGDNQTNTNGSRSFNLNGGRANLGAGGISSTGSTTAARVVNLGAATLGARADWSSSLNMTLTDLTTGTTVTTLDSVDNTTARNIAITGNLTGIGALNKAGAGTLTFSGINTYTGATQVSGGTLALVGGSQASAITVGNGSSLGFTLGSTTISTASVTFDLGSTVVINGTPTLASYTLMTALSFGGITPVLASPVAGYGLTLEGGNTLKLVQLGYGAWAALNGAGDGLDGDHDGDGVSNGVEYLLGGPNGNTTGFTSLPSVVDNSGVLCVTWPKGTSFSGVYGTDYTVETSTTLSGEWTTETILGGNITDSSSSVRYTFPGEPPFSGKKFVRLKVQGP